MKIATVQFNPALGQAPENIARADSLLKTSDVRKGDVDLLILPELAFSGYNFSSAIHINPHLESQATGSTRSWAVKTAQRLACYVIVGYPESTVCPHGPKHDVRCRYGQECTGEETAVYNSALVVGPDGKLVGNYRKTHLYYSDESWAVEGKGFFCEALEGLGKVGLGICMDINPYQFTAPWTAYEFANHVLAGAARLVVLSMAWLTRLEPAVLEQSAAEPDMDTLTYWLERFYPCIAAQLDYDVIAVFCNRCGTEPNMPRIVHAKSGQVVHLLERTVSYAGSSCVVKFKAYAGGFEIMDVLGKGEERVLMVDTEEHVAKHHSTAMSRHVGEYSDHLLQEQSREAAEEAAQA